MPAKTNSLTKAPYDENGSLLHWVGYSHDIWHPNDPFHAALQVVSMRSGYSAKYLILQSPGDTRRSYPMFVADLVDVVASVPLIRNGVIQARWIVRKRGQNYGVTIAPEGM